MSPLQAVLKRHKKFKAIAELLPLLTAIAYLAATIIGYAVSVLYFLPFDIDYLQFAGLTDYLKLPLAQPGFLLSCLLVLILYFSFKERQREDERHGFKAKLKGLAVVVTLLIAALVPFWTIDLSVSDVKGGRSTRFDIVYGNEKLLHCGGMIGTAGDYYFFWDRNSSDTVIIDKSQIVSMRVVLGAEPKADRYDEPLKPGMKVNENGSNFHSRLFRWQKELWKTCGEVQHNSYFGPPNTP